MCEDFERFIRQQFLRPWGKTLELGENLWVSIDDGGGGAGNRAPECASSHHPATHIFVGAPYPGGTESDGVGKKAITSSDIAVISVDGERRERGIRQFAYVMLRGGRLLPVMKGFRTTR